MLPSNCIITNSDKNIGVSILPFSWYKKEYEVQIEKGGYKRINMTEDQCLAMLCGKVKTFQENYTTEQKQLIKKYIPYSNKDSYKLGVLKLIPKVMACFYSLSLKVVLF